MRRHGLVLGLLVACLLWVSPAWAAPAWVKDVVLQTALDTTPNNSQIVTTGQTVAQGNTLIVVGGRYINAAGDTIASVMDSQGNTYTVDVAGFNMGGADAQVGVARGYMTTALTATDTVTIQWTNAAATSYFFGQLIEYSGIASTTPKDQTANATAFRTQADGITSGATPTTTQADELLFGVLHVQSGTETISAGTNWTMRTQSAWGGGSFVQGVEDQVVSATGAYTATGSWVAGSQTEGAIIVTYKAASVATTNRRHSKPF